TGRSPAMQRPTAVPRIPASASGVSTQRSGPKRSRRPAVARKTPPARPTSSPMTRTESSRASSVCRASFTASTMKSSANVASEDPPQLRELALERVRRIRVRVLEEQRYVGLRLGLGGGDPRPHELGRFVPDRLVEVVAENPEPAEIALVAAEALVLPLLLDALEVDVRARIVGGRVRRGAVRDSFDERRPAAAARTFDGLARRLVHGEDVAPVDAHARNAVARGLVDERGSVRLRRERRRDRPAVVVAEENRRRLHHS